MNKENIKTIRKQISECEEKNKFVINQNFKKVINDTTAKSELEDISGTWEKADLQTKKRFQNFIFPKGVTYDGNKFGTAKLSLCIQ